MPEQSPQQPFDSSFFAALLATPQPDLIPPDVSIEHLSEEALQEIETFDWESYNTAFFDRIPESAKGTQESRPTAAIAGTQIWMARHLPPSVVSHLLQVIPAKLLWNYLNGDDRKELLQIVTRGFQRTPQIVRQPVVRNRWLHWLETNQNEIYVLLVMWSLREPQSPSIAFTQNEPDDAKLARKLPSMFRNFGIEDSLCGLSIATRPRVFRAVAELLADKEELERLMQKEADDEELAEGAGEETAAIDDAPAPEADSSLTLLKESLEQAVAKGERLNRSLTRQKEEIESLHKREHVIIEQWTRKLEGAQKKSQAEAEELRKNAERLSRKLRTLEREKEELETENRRLKKQLRHSALLLEEERRKGSQSEIQAPKPVVAPAPKKEVAQPPAVLTPLDEVFEWRADGRPVKVTPRAVRLLIDRNDEDAVFAVMQALESLKLSDKATYSKFLKRLGEAGSFYPRVFTERTTRVLVDASNVARHVPTRRGKGRLSFLLQMREELRRLNCFPILFYADASLRHFIDEPQKYGEMVARGEIVTVDKGVEADEILAREARRTGAYVLTNDARFFHKVSPDFEPPRVSFRIYDGTVIVDDLG
jgi:hypothetical protein